MAQIHNYLDNNPDESVYDSYMRNMPPFDLSASRQNTILTEMLYLGRNSNTIPESLKQKKDVYTHTFITFNFDASCNISQKVEQLHKKKYKYLKGAIHNVEFFGEGKNYHPHIHLFIPYYTPLWRIKRDFKTYCKANFIDVKHGYDCDKPNRISYLKGEKKDVYKQELHRLDLEHGQKLGIKCLFHFPE